MKTNVVIIISGPTASGKTSTSLGLAKILQEDLKKKVCIVNFDSLLFYKELSIGTAKPNEQELKQITHELIDIETISQPLNAADCFIIQSIHFESQLN